MLQDQDTDQGVLNLTVFQEGRTSMSIEARREYLRAIRERYRKACRSEKTGILNEFCEVCRYSRKYAIRILRRQAEMRLKKPGPKATYDLDVVRHLRLIWLSANQMCSSSLKAALPVYLSHYSEPGLTPEVREKLLRISPSTMDRLLKPYRQSLGKGLSSTRGAARGIKNKIPIQLIIGREIQVPGYLEADTVAHCGDSLAGFFVNSLTMTDIFSSWTENRATWTKGQTPVLEAIRDIEGSLPFEMTGFACDNGTEFLNYELLKYFRMNRETPIEFARRRPYKKNDNAHVEQKNWTHVRQIFGYERLEERELVTLMNEIYRDYWNPLFNFFFPCRKLVEKTRIGGRIKKRYDQPKTPYQRLIECGSLDPETKQALKDRYAKLNPFELQETLKSKLSDYRERLRRLQFRKVG
jgi:hypothetical protein